MTEQTSETTTAPTEDAIAALTADFEARLAAAHKDAADMTQNFNAAVDERVQAKVAELQADFEAAVQARAAGLVKALEASGVPPVSAGGYDAAEAEKSAAARQAALDEAEAAKAA